MSKQFIEMSLDMIRDLQAKGFTGIQFELLDTGNSTQATVEVIPCKSDNFQLDRIPLDSRETLDYFEKPSPMARYLISQRHLQGSNSNKTV